MKLDYKIDENDFLIYQLFIASKSDRIKKKRQRNRIVVPLIYIAFGLVFLNQDRVSLAIMFSITALLWFFIYPVWERRHYINHYKSFILENYKDSFENNVTLEFSDEYILAKDSGSETKILTTELKEICEIPTSIFLRLQGGQSFILPKHKIRNIDSVKASLQELANYLKINYSTDENWKWK
jgi:hypothetical protein